MLCAQPLSAEAASRFQTLEDFVKGELQAKAKALRKQLSTSLDEFNSLPLQEPGDDVLLQELAAENPGAASACAALLERARVELREVQTHQATGEPKLGAATIPGVPAALVELPSILRQRAVELQKAGTATAQAILQAELSELDATAKLASQAEQVKREAGRLARREVLEKAKKFSTRGVSELSKRLTTQYVSDALCARFQAEITQLGLEYPMSASRHQTLQRGSYFTGSHSARSKPCRFVRLFRKASFGASLWPPFLRSRAGTTSVCCSMTRFHRSTTLGASASRRVSLRKRRPDKSSCSLTTLFSTSCFAKRRNHRASTSLSPSDASNVAETLARASAVTVPHGRASKRASELASSGKTLSLSKSSTTTATSIMSGTCAIGMAACVRVGSGQSKNVCSMTPCGASDKPLKLIG